MIEGAVNAAYEGVVTLPLRGPDGHEWELDAVVDTGFSGFLAFPSWVVVELGLPYRGRGEAILADGSVAYFNVYDVTVIWDGIARYITADALNGTPLVGMSLLDNHDLFMQVRDGGRVTIQASESD